MKKYIIVICAVLCALFYNIIPAYAVPENSEEVQEEAPEDSSVIETNEIPNWPMGPEINAHAGFLFEANTGVVLYAKNMHEKLYPASTTKLMTALLAAQNSKMDEIVTFSYDAVFSLEPGSSNIGIDPGQSMPMEECLYGIMVGSANEVSNAVAEHVGGSIDGFVKMMNDKAKELGLTDTHFVNTNGLHDENHYTSAHDLAIIAREFFKDENLSKIGNTSVHHFEPTPSQPDDFYVRNKHKLINGEVPYSGIKGGKTGYTDSAGETLVTVCEQNGMRLIAVVLKDNSPDQFDDTVKLFDYGFSNFMILNVAENETKYSIKSNNFFPTNTDILGNTKQILELNEDNYIIMPKNLTMDELTSKIKYLDNSEDEVAQIEYSYHDAFLGYGSLNVIKETHNTTSAFDPSLTEEDIVEEVVENPPIFINIINIGVMMLAIAILGIIVSTIVSVCINYNFLDNLKTKRRNKSRRRRKDKGGLKF